MPRVFDNIVQPLLPALTATLNVSQPADFCVGYFNLRGWREVDASMDRWDGATQFCRVIVGMQRHSVDQLCAAYSLAEADDEDGMDNQVAIRLKRKRAA